MNVIGYLLIIYVTPFALQRIDILCINAKIMPERSLQ
jgi:hypothetical protein